VTLPRLQEASRSTWAPQVIAPSYLRGGEPGVLHLGLGAFHRAHQALVFEHLLSAGDGRWGIHGVGMTRPDLVDCLKAQDGLYAVRVADAQGLKWQVCGALWRLSVAAHQRPEVVQAMAHPALRWITLTVTEKGYGPELGQLLADGLRLRQAAGGAGLTVASCDNLRGNGQVLQALVLAACPDEPLRDWIATHCAFPCSMVDRIVPAMSAPIREQAQAVLGVNDQAALGTEGFWEWVIENRFADPGDAAVLQSAGVQVTDQVPVYEDAKLRMLNGSHSAMALIGAVTGRACISDCIEQSHIRDFITRLIEREVAPHLARSDWRDYRDALLRRFANPHLRHSVHQIATDSSLKIAQRWPPSILGQLQQGGSIDHHALAAAVWLRYALGHAEDGTPYAIQDPSEALLRDLAARQHQAPQASVQALLARTELWGPQLPGQSHWVARVTHWHQRVLEAGVDGAVRQLLQEIA
jgi:fructuronate reductase